MAFLFYLLGFIVIISGLASLATLLGVAQLYVGVGAFVLLVIGVAFSAANARARAEEPA